MTSAENVTSLPLRGIRVIDQTSGFATTTTRLLADLGADVVRFEPPEGSASRRRAPFVDGRSLFDLTHNANKRSIVAPVGSSGDAEFGELVATVDIMVTDDLPADAQGFTSGLLKFNPRLVIVLVSDFGLDGPYRAWAATEWVLQAMTGLLSSSGPAGTTPTFAPGSIVSESAAAQIAWATLLAFMNAQLTGVGDVIDASLFESAVHVIDPGFGIMGSASLSAVSAAGAQARQDVSFRYPVFECADGFVRICVLAVRQWRALRAWLGEPEDFASPELDAIGARFAARGRLYPLIAELFRNQTRADLMAQGRARGIPVQGLLSVDEVVSNEHFRERGAFVDPSVPGLLELRLPNGIFQIGEARAGVRNPGPDLGQDPGARTQDSAAAISATSPRSGSPSGTSAARSLPLQGLRVLDLGVIVVGAETGRLFADYGAEVIKVENSAYPDGFRAAAPGGMGESFARGHRNKVSLGLNLRHGDGVELFKRLVAESDIVLSNFKPGTMESLGLGFEDLRAVNPDIVVVESSAFGPTGPWSQQLGYGPLVRSATGLSRLWHGTEGTMQFGDAETVYPDHVAARLGAIAALAAVIGRSRGHRTGLVSIAQAEIILEHLSDVMALESVRPGSGEAWARSGTGDAPCGVYPCAGTDEWVVVCVRDDEDFANLFVALGLEHELGDGRFVDAAARMTHRSDLDVIVSRWTRQRCSVEAMTVLQRAGVPAGAMRRPKDQIDDPHLRARGVFTSLRQRQLDEPVVTQGAPALFWQLRGPRLDPAPAQFEHTRTIMEAVLGLDQETLQDLLDRGVLEERS